MARRRSWFVLLPVIVLVLLAAAWSAVWMYLHGRVETELERGIARQAAEGRQITCGERQVGGYPFRITVTCTRATLVESRRGPVQIEAERVLAIAQVYRPNHLIVEVTGPVRIREPGPGGRDIATAEWASGRASIVHDAGRAERVSIALDRPSVTTPQATAPVRATAAEFHLRRRPDGAAAGNDDVAVRLTGVEGPLAFPGIAGASDIELQASVSALDRANGASGPDRLRSWAQAGGRLRVTVLRLVSQGAAAETSGDLGFDANGRLEGALRLAVHDLERVFRDLVQARLVPREMMTAVPTLNAIGQPADVGGRRAVSLPISLREGLIRIGPLPIGAVPRVF